MRIDEEQLTIIDKIEDQIEEIKDAIIMQRRKEIEVKQNLIHLGVQQEFLEGLVTTYK